MAYTPTASFLRFLTLSNYGWGNLVESGNSSVGYTYSSAHVGDDGNGNGADQSIGSTQEGSIECVIASASSVAFLGLSTSNAAQDQSTWDYGIQFNNGDYYIVIDGTNGQTPNDLNAAAFPSGPGAGDTIRLRKVGIAYAVILAEVLPAGGSDWLVLWAFTRKPTTTLYPALQSYGTSVVNSFGPMILRIGQAQARVPDNTFNVLIDGDSLSSGPALRLPDMAPFAGTGTTFTDVSVPGTTFPSMLTGIANVNNAWVSGKTNLWLFNGGTNDSSISGNSNATIVSNMTAYVASGEGTHHWDYKYWRGTIPRAGTYANQTARDTGNGTGTSGLKGLDASVSGALATIGLTGWINMHRSGSPWNSTTYLQADFDAMPSWQESPWPGYIHPTKYRGEWLTAKYMSDDLSAALVSSTKDIAFSISESQANTPVLARKRNIIFTDSLAQSLAVAALKRTRNAAFTVTEAQTASASMSRLRRAAFTVTEAESLSAVVKRSRNVAASIVESIAYSFTLAGSGPKLFAFTIAEAQSHVAALARQRNVTFTDAEVNAISIATLNRARSINLAVAESEAIAASLKRLRTVSANVAETETLSASLGRARRVAASVVESLAYSFTFATAGQKLLAFTISEVAAHVVAFARTRNVTFTEAEVQALALQTINRARGLTATIAETTSISATIQRVRSAALAVTESMGVQASVSRFRRVISTILESEGINFTLTTRGLEPDEVNVTVTWDEWTVTADGKLQLIARSEVVSFEPLQGSPRS